MNFLIFFMLFSSFIYAIFSGNMAELSNAALTECTSAVTLCITLCGTICFWSGIMNVAQKSGIANKLSKIVSPLLRLLFPKINPNGNAMSFIVMNFISNLLGLGNASTPLGIKAMNELKKEEGNPQKATFSMIMLTVMNTASIQLFPSTIVAVRAKYGSASPADILPCVWIVSVFVFAVCVLCTFIFESVTKRRDKAELQ